MEPEGSLPRSQKLSSGPYSKAAGSIQIQFCSITILLIFAFHLRLGFQVISFLQFLRL
jgi:hypothetical protein